MTKSKNTNCKKTKNKKTINQCAFTDTQEDVWIRREELTFEMLALEPRASDDETLESEASIGTADSSENLNVDSEGTTSDFSGVRLY